MHAKNVPKRAILGEQGEFYTARAVRRGLLGEFCTGSGAVRVSNGRSSSTHGHRSLALLCPPAPRRPHTNGAASLIGGSTRRLEAQLRPPSTPSDANGPPSAHEPPKPGMSTDKGIIGFT